MHAAQPKVHHPKSKIILLAIGLLLIAAMALAILLQLNPKTAANPTVAPKLAAISLSKSGFTPKTLTIAKGTTVQWTSVDNTTTHIIESSSKGITSLTSPQLGVGAKYRFSFDTPGTYQYHDKLDPTRGGTIVVR